MTTTTLTGGDRITLFVPLRQSFTVVAAAIGSASVTRLGDHPGEASQGAVAISDAETKTIGPFATPTRHDINCLTGSISFTAPTPVAFPTTTDITAADAAIIAANPAMVGTVGDFLEYIGAGAPVDYTDGTPPATGEGVAGIGSRYTDVTAGKLYLNAGTKAQPIWKLVTSAA